MEKDKKKKSQPQQPKRKTIDVEVGSVKSLRANYLNQLDASEIVYKDGEETGVMKKRTFDMTKDKRTSFDLFDLPSDAASDDLDNDDLTSVTPSEAEGAHLQLSPTFEQVQRCQATRDSIARLLQEKKDDDVEKEREDEKDMYGWNTFVKPDRQQGWLSESSGSTLSEMMTNFPQRKSRQNIDGVLSIHVQESVAHL